jgi:hypothetical protein
MRSEVMGWDGIIGIMEGRRDGRTDEGFVWAAGGLVMEGREGMGWNLTGGGIAPTLYEALTGVYDIEG